VKAVEIVVVMVIVSDNDGKEGRKEGRKVKKGR
jgi:hypothetical protein